MPVLHHAATEVWALDRKLLIDEAGAVTVRTILREFLRLISVQRLREAALYFHFGDWLGTLRVVTDAAGNVNPSGATCINLPYGNGEYCTPTQSTNYLFTRKERDPETNGPNGNDYFGARYYASTMGQFLTPDWSAKAEPVP